MYPQNPYQPGQTPQQSPPANLENQPRTLTHSNPVQPGIPTPQQPVPLPQYTSAATPAPLPAQPAPAPIAANNTLTPPAPLSNNGQFTDQQAEAYPIDYLNQIAPTQQKSINRFAVFSLIGGVLVALIAAVAIFAGMNKSTAPSLQMQQTLARVNTLQKIATSQQKHLTENSLNEANATLDSTLSSMSTDLTAVMKQKGVKTTDSKSPTAKTEAAYQAALQKKLDDSYQRGRLDRNYTSQMRYELTILRSKLTKLQAAGKSKTITAFCTSAVTNVDAILKAYDTYDASTK